MAQYIWPVPGYDTITSGVGARWGTTHKGIDISAPQGTEVVAADAGKVIDVVNKCTHNYGKSKSEMESDPCGGGYGNRVYIQHADGQVTRYAHLTSANVRVGDIVTQGQVIGTVGSTGHSTGNHLHFEVRPDAKSQTYLDPENYVNPSNTILPKSSSTHNSTLARSSSHHISSYNTTALKGGSGRTTGSRDEALYAYFKLYLGNGTTSLEFAVGAQNKYSIYQSMEITRLQNGASTIQFVLFDDDWIKLEKILVDNYDHMELEYGWQDGLKSDRHKIRLSTYTIDLYDTGVLLKIEAISEEAYKNLDPVEGFDTGTKNPTEAIKRIAEYMGYEATDLVATQDVPDREENYILYNDNPFTYISETILPEAKTASGDPVVIYMTPSNSSRALHLASKSINTDNYRTYIYQKGYNSEVESISFDIGGVFGGTTQLGIASTSKGIHINKDDKTEESKTYNQEDVSKNQSSQSDPLALKIQSGQSTAIENYSRDSRIQIDNKTYYGLINKSSEQYKATMTIIGDPTINVLDSVNILIYDENYNLYHTSGIYMVLKVMDTIENGTYKTTLELGAHHNFDGEIMLTYD